MKNRFFIHPYVVKRLLVLLLISFLVSWTFFFLYIAFTSFIFFLFRKKKIDEAKLRSSDNSLVLSPISGHARIKESGGKFRITIGMGVFRGFGVAMPFEGEVTSFIETSENISLFNFLPLRKSKIIVTMKSELFGELKIVLMRTGFIFRPSVWVRSGDRALVGAYIGFIPFGGKVVIEMKNSVNLLIKDKSKVLTAQTLLASNRIEND